MIVGNMFNHGLYHGLIPVMNLPFLNSEPADVMNLVKVRSDFILKMRNSGFKMMNFGLNMTIFVLK